MSLYLPNFSIIFDVAQNTAHDVLEELWLPITYTNFKTLQQQK